MPEPQSTHSVSPPLDRIGSPPVVQVEVLERQDLVGPGCGLAQHPPQRLFPQRDVATGELALDEIGTSAGWQGGIRCEQMDTVQNEF